MARTKVHGEYLDPSVISAQTEVTAVGSDHMLIFDATDNALKKALLSDLIETVGSTPTFTGLTVNSSEVLFDNTGGDFTLKLNTNAVGDKNEIIMGDTGTPLAKFGVGGTADDIITGSDGQDFNIGTSGGGRAINFSTDNYASVEMKLDGGNLGIGTDNPLQILHIKAASPNILLEGTNYPSLKWADANDPTTADAEIYYGVSGLDWNFNNYNNGLISFKTNNQNRLTLSNSGDLDLLTGRLKVINSGTDAYFFEGVRSGGNVTLRMYDNNNNLYIDSYTNMSFRANQTGGGSGGNIFFGGGNVLVGGSTNRNRKLVVEGTGDLMGLYSTNSGAGGAQLDFIHDSPSKADNDSLGLINFSDGTIQYGSIKGISKSTSAQQGRLKLGVRAASGDYRDDRVVIDHNTTFLNNRLGLNYPSELMFNGEYNGGGQDVAVEAGHAARIEFLKDDFLRFQGSASVAAGAGVAYADKLKINIDSGGILFGSDTAAANTLDDYEEGSFTPSLQNTGNATPPTGYGYYCKIGGVVYVSMYFAGITITSAGNTRIAGMPFAASVPGSAYSICYYTHGTILSDNRGGGGYFTSTFIDLIAFGSTGYNSWSVGNTKYGMWSGFYFTNS